jgi:hypothetical protein
MFLLYSRGLTMRSRERRDYVSVADDASLSRRRRFAEKSQVFSWFSFSYGDGLREMSEVTDYVAVHEVNFDNHRFDSGLLRRGRLEHRFHQAANRDVVVTGWAGSCQDLLVINSLFVEEGFDPRFE